MKQAKRVAVIGGGIAGLSAAYFLNQADFDVTVLEGSPSIGGKLRLGEIAGICVDLGAESILARRPEGIDLIGAIGLARQIVYPKTTAAGVWSRGELHSLPPGHVMGIPTELRGLRQSGLISRAGLARIGLDRVRPRTGFGDDISVARYVGGRLGSEVVDRIVEPLLGGVYAGRADQLSFAATLPDLAKAARTERSLIAAARKIKAAAGKRPGPIFAGLTGGIGQIPDALATASKASIRTNAAVRGLARTPSGWRLTVGSRHAEEAFDADAVVVAVPAQPASRLLSDLPAAADLASIEYASVAVVTLAYPRTTVPPVLLGGSGFLVPPVERRTVKAVTVSTAKWAWVADAEPGTVVVRASIGRIGEVGDLQRDDKDLAELAVADLSAMTGLPRPSEWIVTRWGGGLPQYTVGHAGRVARIKAAVAAQPGLAVCGAAYDGLGIPACIASGKAAAEQIMAAR